MLLILDNFIMIEFPWPPKKSIKVYINAGSFIVIDIEIQSHACAGRMVMVNICSRKLGPQAWG
jgi:hypothetical protein